MGNQWSSEYDANDPVDLRHFKLGRSIGRGAFGKVKVVVKRDTKKLYALKYINKEQCIKKRAYRNIFRERTLLENLEHPFIVNLRFAFQDDENMFMVLDLMLGGDLRFHLNRMGKFTERMVVFYAAELASALMYIHSRRVIHRDIKPDNVLLDADGHVHLTDFNCATVLEEGKRVTSETGTQGYMAPEVYGEQGYGEAVDWWSLGIVLFECLHGERPFSASRVDRLIHKVKTAPINYAEDMSRRMRSLLEGFLDRDPKKRLGSGPKGVAEVMQHSAFKRIDWHVLQEKEIEPPFVPDDRKLNFDARYELEEILLEENPLHAKPRKRDRSQQSREMRLIESEFKAFDYTHLHRFTSMYEPVNAGIVESSHSQSQAGPPPPATSAAAVESVSAFSERAPPGGDPRVTIYPSGHCPGRSRAGTSVDKAPDASQLPTEFAGPAKRRDNKGSHQRPGAAHAHAHTVGGNPGRKDDSVSVGGSHKVHGGKVGERARRWFQTHFLPDKRTKADEVNAPQEKDRGRAAHPQHANQRHPALPEHEQPHGGCQIPTDQAVNGRALSPRLHMGVLTPELSHQGSEISRVQSPTPAPPRRLGMSAIPICEQQRGYTSCPGPLSGNGGGETLGLRSVPPQQTMQVVEALSGPSVPPTMTPAPAAEAGADPEADSPTGPASQTDTIVIGSGDAPSPSGQLGVIVQGNTVVPLPNTTARPSATETAAAPSLGPLPPPSPLLPSLHMGPLPPHPQTKAAAPAAEGGAGMFGPPPQFAPIPLTGPPPTGPLPAIPTTSSSAAAAAVPPRQLTTGNVQSLHSAQVRPVILTKPDVFDKALRQLEDLTRAQEAAMCKASTLQPTARGG